MKLRTLLITCFCMQFSIAALAQGITLSEKNASLQSIFDKIFRQTGYEFFYKSEIIDNSKTISIDVVNQPLESVLDLCFRDQPLEYGIRGKIILIKARVIPTIKYRITVSGIVTADSGEPLEAVTIKTKNSGKGTLTDIKGIFTLRDIAAGTILLFSAIGYDPLEVTVNNNSWLPVKMRLSVKRLDETVLVAYGKTSRRFNTGNIGKISAEEIGMQPVSNPLAALSGRIPGLDIQQVTGVPGGAFNVFIRGRNSMANGNEPLFIVDGMPFYAQSLHSPVTAGLVIPFASPLDNLNPLDIESIEVLKDADATAIYGSRGANGVILINTKKSRPGKVKIDLNSSAGFARITRQVKMLNTRDYLAMRRQAFRNDAALPQSIDHDVNGDWDTTRYTNWPKELIGGTAQVTNLQLSVSGGSRTTQFLFSSNYRKETTVFPGSAGNKKASFNLSINYHSVDEKLKLQLNNLFMSNRNRLYKNDLTQIALSQVPNSPELKDAAGNLNWESGFFDNPLSYLLRKYKADAYSFLTNTNLEYAILKNLSVKTDFSYSSTQLEEVQASPLGSFWPGNGYNSGSTSFADSHMQSWILEPQLIFTKMIGRGRFNAVAGATIHTLSRKQKTSFATGFPNDDLLEDIDAASSVTLDPSHSSSGEYKYQALFGRINYTIAEKYLLNLTARRDGSSRFGPGKQFANFGAFGTAWIFTREKFMSKANRWLSYGKLRLSFGTSGNDQIGDYQYLDVYSQARYPYQGGSSLVPVRLLNPDYAWELNKKLEAGLDIGFLQDRLLVSVSCYRNRSSNQLVGYSLPFITGFSSVQFNLPAIVENKGLEAEINTVNIRTKKWNWNTSFVVTVPDNKLVAYPNIEGSAYRDVYIVGRSMNIRKLFAFTGVDPETGVYSFEDIDKNGSIEYPNDLQTRKEIAKSWYGGFRSDLKYRKWRFDIFLQVVKQTGYNYLATSYAVPGAMANQPAYVLDRWQKPGDISSVQRYTQDYGSGSYNQYLNSVYLGDNTIGDASYIRVKNISLSYEMGLKGRLARWVRKAIFFAEGQNIFTYTKYRGMDPENQSMNTLPPLAVIAGGFQITF